MLLTMNTILIIGATSGIGEAFARRFHDLGKKVIITGRREDRLSSLAKELSGLETRQVLHVSPMLPLLPKDTTNVLLSIVGCYRLRLTSKSSFSHFEDPPRP